MKWIIVNISIIAVCVATLIYSILNENKTMQPIIRTENSQITMERYMENVVATYMEKYDNFEAMKAFAVIVRSNIMKDMQGNNFKSCNEDDLYIKFSKYANKSKKKSIMQKARKAVKATEGEIITYKNTLVRLPFHEVSGSKTNTTMNGNNKIPYLKEAYCKEDIENKDYMRIEYITINDNYDTKNLENKLYDNCNIDENVKCQIIDNKLRIVSVGKGHGYGMSLYNSYILGLRGVDYKTILNKFYTNVKIIKTY